MLRRSRAAPSCPPDSSGPRRSGSSGACSLVNGGGFTVTLYVSGITSPGFIVADQFSVLPVWVRPGDSDPGTRLASSRTSERSSVNVAATGAAPCAHVDRVLDRLTGLHRGAVGVIRGRPLLHRVPAAPVLGGAARGGRPRRARRAADHGIRHHAVDAPLLHPHRVLHGDGRACGTVPLHDRSVPLIAAPLVGPAMRSASSRTSARSSLNDAGAGTGPGLVTLIV